MSEVLERKLEVILIGFDFYTAEIIEQCGCKIGAIVKFGEAFCEVEFEEWMQKFDEASRPAVQSLQSDVVTLFPCYVSRDLSKPERQSLLKEYPGIFWGTALRHPTSWVSENAILGLGSIVGPLARVTSDYECGNLVVL